VDDCIHTLHRTVHRHRVGEVGQHDFFSLDGVSERLNVGQAQYRAIGLEALTQGLAQATSGTRQQQFFENLDRHFLFSAGCISTKHWTFF